MRPSGTVSAEIAAALLDTTPATVQLWAERFGYPVPAHGPEDRVRYSYATVVALREAMAREVSITSAVVTAMRTAPA